MRAAKVIDDAAAGTPNINTQQIVQNPVGFTEQQAITMGKIIGSQISLKADVENNKLAIAVNSATQPMAGKPLTS
mgnify:CR=1 FL=1